MPGLFGAIGRSLPAHFVLIDGECGRCTRTARVLGGLDWFDRLQFGSLQDESIRRHFGLNENQDVLLESMHAIGPDGKISRGYRACLGIGTSVPLLWPLRPLGAILLIGNAGEHIYQRMARSRKRNRIDRCVIHGYGVSNRRVWYVMAVRLRGPHARQPRVGPGFARSPFLQPRYTG